MSDHQTNECVTQRLFSEERSERALMGPAHAISGAGAAALFAGVLSFFYAHQLDFFFASSILIAILFALVATGGALVPDLDNSRSTVMSSLGFVGVLFSGIFRFTSLGLQKTIRTSKDEENPNPHRGFWHTLVGAAVLGGSVWGLTSIDLELARATPIGDITVGGIATVFFTAVFVHLCLAGVAKQTVKKIKDIPVAGELLAFATSLALTLSLLSFAPNESTFWLGFAVFFGATLHILGDALTVAGVPIFFPLTVFTRRRFWWKTRFAKFKADNEALNSVIKWLSIVALVAGIALFIAGFFV